MLNKVIYEFAIIRLVPKVERAEFINIGVILLCKSKNYLKIKSTLNAHRLIAFDHSINMEMIHKHLNAWQNICHGAPQGGDIGSLEIRVRFRWLTANRSTILQCSPVHSGLCFEPEKLLKQLFQSYVL